MQPIDVIVPTQEIVNSHPEENEAFTYAFQRKWNEAYWAAIRFAYSLSKQGFTTHAASRMAYEEFSKEIEGF